MALNSKHTQPLIDISRRKSARENPWRKVTVLKSLFPMVVILTISCMSDEKIFKEHPRGALSMVHQLKFLS